MPFQIIRNDGRGIKGEGFQGHGRNYIKYLGFRGIFSIVGSGFLWQKDNNYF
jgi:hypothetical protein